MILLQYNVNESSAIQLDDDLWDHFTHSTCKIQTRMWLIHNIGYESYLVLCAIEKVQKVIQQKSYIAHHAQNIYIL